MPAKILIVDDYSAMRSLVKRVLAHHLPGLTFLESHSAEDALAQVAHDAPQAVIMDVDMPGMNGLDATRRIAHEFPACAVIVHAGVDEPGCGADEAHRVGARCFVRKGDCDGLVAATARALAM